MNRRHFLQSALYANLLYGAGSLPRLINESSAAFQPLGSKRVLLNMMMRGGPDMRHIIVPEFSDNAAHFGYHYWRNRTRSHGIGITSKDMRDHWADNFTHHNTEGPFNSPDGVNFGIATSCGWLAQMWEDKNVAIVCNTFGKNTRDHDYAQLIMNQGNRSSSPGQLERSGWGGRLAVAAGSNVVSLTNIPPGFCFGPGGTDRTDINVINNANLVSVSDSRNIGLYEFDRTIDYNSSRNQAARASKSYYKTLRAELPEDSIYQRFLAHEESVRFYGGLIQERLHSVPIPARIHALYNTDNDNVPLLDPEHQGRDLGYQIRNAYDTLASHDLLDAKVLSMEIGGWDSHDDQAIDMNPRFSNLFGVDKAFSALWQALEQDAGGNVNRENLVIMAGGEFGRQLRDNGGNGTDHGEGNMCFVFGEQVNGGVYGDLFPENEIMLIQDQSINTPDTKGLTHWDHPFSAISNWVHSGSSSVVFPDLASAEIEELEMFDTLFPSEINAL